MPVSWAHWWTPTNMQISARKKMQNIECICVGFSYIAVLIFKSALFSVCVRQGRIFDLFVSKDELLSWKNNLFLLCAAKLGQNIFIWSSSSVTYYLSISSLLFFLLCGRGFVSCLCCALFSCLRLVVWYYSLITPLQLWTIKNWFWIEIFGWYQPTRAN